MRDTAIAACVCAGVLAWAAEPALAGGGSDPAFPGSSLVIEVAGPFVQGKPFHFLATGLNAAPLSDESGGGLVPYYLFVYVLNAKVGPCPMTQEAMLQLVKQNPRNIATIFPKPVPEVGFGPGLYGSFTLPLVKVNAGPSFFGSLYICGYSSFAASQDAAWYAYGPITIKPGSAGSTGGGTKPTKPAVTAPPRVTRQGNKLVCSRGSWSGNPASYSYRWVVTHEPGIASLTSTLPVTPGMRGREAECSVTATNSSGSTTAASQRFKIS